MSVLFELDRVCKTFGRQKALDEVTLVGESGTVIALLGENGAGKTTAIRILLGLLPADSGRCSVFGFESWQYGDEIRRRVGYVPDKPTLYEWMTVDEIGWFAGGFYEPGFVPRYRETMTRFAVPLRQKISTLSKGMKAKVSLALATAHEPQLLVLDEPTSGLDPIVRREFLESMVDVAAGGRTVLLSSHQIAEVERVADVVAILRKGRLEVVASLDELKSEVRELLVTLRNGKAIVPDPPATVICRHRQDRQWRMLVRNLDPAHLEVFRNADNVGAVEVRQPTLEDIYVGVMRQESAATTS